MVIGSSEVVSTQVVVVYVRVHLERGVSKVQKMGSEEWSPFEFLPKKLSEN